MAKPRSSCTSLALFKYCAHAWELKNELGLKIVTGDMLLGSAVHSFIAMLHQPTKEPRPFFYLTLDSAKKAWRVHWKKFITKKLKEKNLTIIEYGGKYGSDHEGFGVRCITDYWNANIGLIDPDSIEISKNMWINGFQFPYRPDQIRYVDLDFIKMYRPELLDPSGRLRPKFKEQAIYDIKTTRYPWFIRDEDGNVVLLEKHKELATNFQVIAYSRGYFEQNGKWPIAFVFFTIPGAKPFVVSGENPAQQQYLEDTLTSFKLALNNQFFPKNIGTHCESCLYKEHCDLQISKPQLNFTMFDIFGSSQNTPNSSSAGIKPKKPKQNRLGIKVPKQKDINENNAGQ